MDNDIIIVSSQEDIIAHEHGLYKNFYHVYPSYSERFFNLIDNNRLKPKIPYECQIVYVLKHDDSIICGAGFNTDSNITWVVEQLEFTIDKTATSCEALYFYSTIVLTFGFDIKIYRKLLEFAFNDLLRRNITTVYSTCTEKQIRLYRYIGFDVIGETMLDGEKEFLIKTEIKENFMDNAFILSR